jgi:endonuclease G, mitochondrial
MTENIDIQLQRRLVDVLMKLPPIGGYGFRSSLLQGLPMPPLERSESLARLDLNSIVDGLNKLGRLNDRDGARPLIVVVDNALQYVLAGGEIAQELTEVKRLLAEAYGGDRQVPVAADQKDMEALVFGRQRDSRLAFSFIEGAMRTAKSVARLKVPRIFAGARERVEGKEVFGYGTGWLIAPGIVITNHHVIDNRDIQHGEAPASLEDFNAQAGGIEAWFDYYQEGGGTPLMCSGAQLLANSKPLDYAVLHLAEESKVADRSALPIIPQQPSLVRGARMNLIQHPKGGAIQYAIRNNFFVRPGDAPQFLRYQTDTEPGSSGSPVCNDAWQVVGLHHASTPVPNEQVPQEVIGGQPVTVTLLNEAIAIHCILDDLPSDLRHTILTT